MRVIVPGERVVVTNAVVLDPSHPGVLQVAYGPATFGKGWSEIYGRLTGERSILNSRDWPEVDQLLIRGGWPK